MDSFESLELRDIHLPGSPDFWPLALGWWLFLSLFFFMLLWTIIKVRQRNRSKKKYQILLRRVTELENQLRKNPGNETLAEFNILLRQLAVAYYPRTEIASLTGGDWLNFLDQSGNTHEFSRGAGRILMDAPYQHGSLQNLNIDEFIPLIRSWISIVTTKHPMRKTQIRDKVIPKADEKPLKSGGGEVF
jgi:hypothetical protein